MASTPPDYNLPDLIQQLSTTVNAWQTYINQQRAILYGDAAYTTSTPANQPGPGYYPVTDPTGVVTWAPCLLRMAADAKAFTVGPTLNLSNNHITAAQSGLLNPVNTPGGSANVNVIFDAGIKKGFNALFLAQTANKITFSPQNSTVTLINDQSLFIARQTGSLITAIAPADNVVVLSGSLRGS